MSSSGNASYVFGVNQSVARIVVGERTEPENLSQSSLCIRVTTLPGLLISHEISEEIRYFNLTDLGCSSMVVRFLSEASNVSFQEAGY